MAECLDIGDHHAVMKHRHGLAQIRQMSERAMLVAVRKLPSGQDRREFRDLFGETPKRMDDTERLLIILVRARKIDADEARRLRTLVLQEISAGGRGADDR